MLIEHPNRQELTTDELQNLADLKTRIERATNNGTISKYEMEAIDRAIYADGKVLVEEMLLLRQCIKDKIAQGLLVVEWEG